MSRKSILNAWKRNPNSNSSCHPFLLIQRRNPIKIRTKRNLNYSTYFGPFSIQRGRKSFDPNESKDVPNPCKKLVLLSSILSSWIQVITKTWSFNGKRCHIRLQLLSTWCKKREERKNIRTIVNIGVWSGEGQNLLPLLYIKYKPYHRRIHTCLCLLHISVKFSPVFKQS